MFCIVVSLGPWRMLYLVFGIVGLFVVDVWSCDVGLCAYVYLGFCCGVAAGRFEV